MVFTESTIGIVYWWKRKMNLKKLKNFYEGISNSIDEFQLENTKKGTTIFIHIVEKHSKDHSSSYKKSFRSIKKAESWLKELSKNKSVES